MAYAELRPLSGGPPVHFDAESDSGLMLGTVDGWYGTSSAKVDLTELSGGNGASAVSDKAILYSSRTVTLGVCASRDTYSELVGLIDSADALAEKLVTIEVDGGEGPTTATGYVQVEWGAGPMPTMNTGTITVVCPDPRRYGSVEHGVSLSPGGNSTGGLDLTDERLAFPLAWGAQAASRNVTTMHNAGTSTAYPTIRVQGGISDVVITNATTGEELTIPGYIGWQPIVLDSMTRTATIDGVDVTRRIGQRHFPTIAPGGDTTLALVCSGTNGAVRVTWHDTYI